MGHLINECKITIPNAEGKTELNYGLWIKWIGEKSRTLWKLHEHALYAVDTTQGTKLCLMEDVGPAEIQERICRLKMHRSSCLKPNQKRFQTHAHKYNCREYGGNSYPTNP
ncbi:hypothetical protein LIER_19718 [Lithospermum erythrorhizon]|uniref:Uncharacterized protein n=1 Tax=Lithospermum erythrorhizon TaxID=34254 RepID=A0AAV3QIT4_LITER